ncbi:MAG: hypothetical protein DRG30_03165 [Epsilonproteobacteria bacterium]|nr:MAG: hypothetical protein DRG30_03165 [Campylobacterota bacterium]
MKNFLTNMRKYLIWALAIGFLAIGLTALIRSQPETKNARVYREIIKYSPYYIDKRVGGLNIKSREDEEFKEKPDNIQLFHRLDELEKSWGKTHLKLKNSQLLILDNNGSTLTTFPLENQDEIDFVHRFYGV